MYLENHMGSFWAAENLYLGVNDHEEANACVEEVLQAGQGLIHVPHVPGQPHGKLIGC